MVLYVMISVTAIACLLYLYFTRTFNYWKDRNIKGPKPVVFFGNLKDTALRKRPQIMPYKEIYDNYPKEKIVGIYRMTTPALVIRDLDLIKNIMIKDFDLFVDRGISFGKDGLGKVLFAVEGNTWRALRTQLSPIFTSGKLRNMLYLITECGDKFINSVESSVEQNPVQDVHSLVSKFTQSTISTCAFGLDLEFIKKEVLKKIDKTFLTLNFVHELMMMYPEVLNKLGIQAFSGEITNFFKDLVKTVFSQRGNKPSGKKDFMDLLLEMKINGEIIGVRRSENDEATVIKLSDDIIAAQAFQFYAGGFETSATTMAFMLYELARNQDIQERLLEEVDKVMAKYNGDVTYDSLKDIPYMDKVFNETLRVYPLVDPIQRRAKKDYKIPGSDTVIPKGTICFVPVMGIHHDEQYYPSPEKFDPERFDPQVARDRHAAAYMPFGIGPRNCIGIRFATVQSRVCLMRFLSSFRVELCSKTQEKMLFDPKILILGPQNGIHLKLVSRKKRT